MRLTAHRREILTLLQTADAALSAAAIHSKVPHINLVTVYRTLESFVEAGMIKKLSLSSDEAVYEFQAERHHHAVCSECGKVLHFTFDDQSLIREFSLPHFLIHDIDVQVRGICSTHKKIRTL